MKNQKPVISVIVPCYNVEKYLQDCLDSVLQQTFKDWEIICIDDNSSDKTWDILQEYAQKDNRIKIFRHDINQGCVKTKNEAVKLSCGEYIYPLDGDDIIAETCLEKLYDAMQKKLGDIITSRVMLFGEFNNEFYLPEPTVFNMANKNCIVNSSLFRRNDFLACGGYDENFNIALEDYDLWLNLMFKHKKTIFRVDELLFNYRVKSIKESRNKAAENTHIHFLIYLELKYPEISIYRQLQQIYSLHCNNNYTYLKLFNLFTLLKIKNKGNCKKFYLFGFLPFLKYIKKDSVL